MRDDHSAAITEWPSEALEPTETPPIRVIETLDPLGTSVSPTGGVVVDFGQNISGRLRIRVTGERGDEVGIRHAELLAPDGGLDVESNRTAEAHDVYTRGSGGLEEWVPEFTIHGFRYAEITGWPGTVGDGDITAEVIHSDMRRTGWFECSDPLVTKLHENAVWSMRGNFVGIPTDCPQRDERLARTGDINAFAPTALLLYDSRAVLGSWLRDRAFEQADLGTVPVVVPSTPSPLSVPTALWGDVAVSLPWQLYLEHGGIEILRDAFASMTAFIDQVEGRLDADGLWSDGFQFGDWLDPDAPTDNPAGGRTDRYLVAQAFFVKTSRELADSAALLDRDSDAARYRALSERARRAFLDGYVTVKGRIAAETATAYALAISFDLLDLQQRQRAGDRLAELVENSRYRISTGFAGTPLVAPALSETGHADVSYRLLMQKNSPSFLYPVTMGATTIWERWDAVLPDGTLNSTGMTSLNHYALGGVVAWLYSSLGGLHRLEPGWTRFRIAAEPGGGITSARTVHDTPLGRIKTDWHIGGGEFRISIEVPDGATAEYTSPWGDVVEVLAPGRHERRSSAPRDYGREFRLGMHSTVRELKQDEAVWDAASDVLKRATGVRNIEAASSQLQGMTLGQIVAKLPGNAVKAEPDAALGAR